MRRDFLALLVLVFLVPSTADGERLPIRAYTTADGLAHNKINKIVRDSRGFLWFATNDGLSRFDGYSFTNYSVEHGLPHPSVMDLLETAKGELWVATFGGLVRFRPEGLPNRRVVFANDTDGATPMFATVVPSDEDERARELIVLLESRDGSIWCGTRNGLYRLERSGRHLELRRVEIGLPAEYPEQRFVKDLIEDERGSLWAAAPSGLYRRWSDGTAARYGASDLVGQRYPNLHSSYDHLHDLMKDRQGRIWVGARGLGFFRITADGSRRAPSVDELHGYPQPLTSWVEETLQTSDGRFWVASNLGLVELVRERSGASRLVAYNRSHGLNHQELTALAEDAAGNLWIGTWANGAMKLARTGFVTYGRQDGIGSAADVFEDSLGTLYVHAGVFRTELAGGAGRSGSSDALVSRFGRFDGSRFRWFQPGQPFVWGWVGERSMTRTRNHEFWLASGRGLFKYPPLTSFDAIAAAKPVRIFDLKDGLPDVQVYRIFEDSRGDVWFSIFSKTNGLFRWSRATDTLHDMALVEGFPRIEDELPRAIREDSAGNIWVGLNNGAARYRNGRFSFFKAADGVPLGAILDIHTDASLRLWLASSRVGLIRVDLPAADQPIFTRYTRAEGLSGNSIDVITEDLQGRLYLATGRGIDQFDPVTGALKQFTTEDGLAAGTTLAASRDRTGALWFATTTGLSRFVPPPPAPSAAPAILITGVTIAGRPWPVSAVGQLSVELPDLSALDRHLQIDFASFRFAAGDRLRYQYRLEGSEEEWGPLTERRGVTYASLSPGRYRFLVRAVNTDGVASPQPAIVGFTVLPPVWLRWWFLSLMALALTAAALGFHRYRLTRILELERVRTRIATDLHDDVGANLTRIAILSEVARQQPAAGGPTLDAPLSSIANIARESVATMSDIVWAINPERDTLRDMVRRMRDHAEEVFESRDIRVFLDLPDGSAKLGVDIRRDLYLIFKEAVNNTARHSGCTAVGIALRTDASRLELEVTDNGSGFDPDAGSDGNGLTSMRRRAERLGASLEVVATAGSGTTVKLVMIVPEWRTPVSIPTQQGR
jgi:signal transduction histidine kinase/ligand-binding sensor domain-containing protein